MDEKPKILIVEDEVDFAKMVKMRLESEGYEVTVAENAHVGTQEILKGDHKLVILDLMMPEDEGFSVRTKSRQSSQNRTIRKNLSRRLNHYCLSSPRIEERIQAAIG